MIKTYRNKKTFEALLWTGKNKEELEDFVGGADKIVWTLSTTKSPKPDILNNCSSKPIEENNYIAFEDDRFEVYTMEEFENLFEEI